MDKMPAVDLIQVFALNFPCLMDLERQESDSIIDHPRWKNVQWKDDIQKKMPRVVGSRNSVEVFNLVIDESKSIRHLAEAVINCYQNWPIGYFFDSMEVAFVLTDSKLAQGTLADVASKLDESIKLWLSRALERARKIVHEVPAPSSVNVWRNTGRYLGRSGLK